MSKSNASGNRGLYVGLGLGAVMLLYILCKYRKRKTIPTKWRRVGTLDQINLYPVKSCAPLKLSANDELFCDTLGLRYKGISDRGLMLVNEKFEMVTARTFPKLVLVKTNVVAEGKLILSAEGMEPIELDFPKLFSKSIIEEVRTSVWGCHVQGLLCGEKYDKWFSQYIFSKDSGLHLLYYPYPVPVRAVNARLVKEPHMTRKDTGTFGDATSYTLMNLASIEHLNTRLPSPIHPLQLRGNFHLKMDINEPYGEDNWEWLRIGEDAVFINVASCTRCILPNIDVNSGERSPLGEPLKELKKYRLLNNHASPSMGIHLGLRRAGTIKANDVIYVNSD